MGSQPRSKGDLSMIKFLYPQAFWGLGILLILFGILWYGYNRRRSLLSAFGQENLIRQTSHLPQNWQQRVQGSLLVGVIIALIVALARPVWPGGAGKLREGSLEVVAILDVSRSMAAEDYAGEISRLKKAKEIVLDLLPDLTGNRMGLVLFARDSFIQASLTGDVVALKFVLQNWVNIESAPAGGSNLVPALQDALDLLEKSDRNKLILLFSDGGDSLSTDLQMVLEKLSSKAIKVVVVGLGNPQGSKIPVYRKDGKFEDWLRINNELVLTPLNEAPLKEIASKTGGKYIRVVSGKELRGMLKDTELVGEKAIANQKELFQIPLGLAFLLFLLSTRRY